MEKSKIMQPLLSIIIPSYNSAKFISSALDSIECQHFKSYEVLIIDAGSDDKTKEICEMYDVRFIFHELKGSNQGEARNLGIYNAKGALIMFLDSDDMLSDSNVLNDCMQKVEESDSDFYNFSISFFKNKKFKREISVPGELMVNGRDTILRMGIFGKHIHTIPWNKIYKKHFLITNNIYFPNLKEQEDMVFVIHCCIKAAKVSFSNRIIVNANIRDDSLSRSMSSVNVTCCLDVFRSLEILLKYENLLDKYKKDFECYKMRTSAYILLMTIDRVKSNDDFWKGVNIIRKSGSLDPWNFMMMLSNMKITTILSIVIAKSTIFLSILRLFRNLKIIRGY